MVKFVNLAEIMGQVDTARARDQGMKLNELLMQRQNRQFQREDQEYANQEAVKGAYRGAINPDGQLNQEMLLAELYKVDPIKANEVKQQFETQKRTATKDALETQKAELGLLADKAKVGRDLIAGLTPETYAQGIQQLQAQGFQIAQSAPPQYDPNWIEKSVMDANAFIKQAQTKQQQEFTANQNDLNRNVTIRGQNISASNAAASRALTQRGQDIAAQTKLMELKNKPVTLSKGQEQVDKDFAKEYAKSKASGGFADSQKLINQLQEASDALASDDSLTGAFVGAIPDAVRAVTNPKAINTREKVEEVVQRNLREVLGAQFTQKEGDRLIARAFNPRLSTEVNKQRVDALITQMKNAAKTKNDAIQYFEKNGTLQGWGGNLPTMRDFENVLDNVKTPSNKSKTIQDADAILGL